MEVGIHWSLNLAHSLYNAKSRNRASSDCSAMRCEGYESAAEARAPDSAAEERDAGFACISPWSIFRRWSSGGKSRFSKSKFVERNWGKGKNDGDLGLQRELTTVPSSSAEDFRAKTGKEASLSIGVGYGLIYLLKYELNKMVELRRRIESLLYHFQTEIESRGKKYLHITGPNYKIEVSGH